MTRVAFASIAAALAAVGVATGGSAPRVALVRASPVIAAGSGYPAHAHLRIVYRSGVSTARRTVVASSHGAFRIVFARLRFERCAGFSLFAGAASIRVASCNAGGSPTVTGDPGGAVSGYAFVPGERVTVVAHVREAAPVASVVTAGGSGTFTVRLRVPHLACSQVDYVATGSLGSRARYSVPAPACMAP